MFHSCAQTPNDSHVKTGTYGPVFTWQGLQDYHQTYCGLISFPDEEGRDNA